MNEYTRHKIYHLDAPSRLMRMIAARVPLGSAVLDVGCGTGCLGEFLRNSKRCYVVGVEIAPEAAAAARTRCDEVVQCDVAQMRDWDGGGRRFDRVIFSDVIEHLADPRATLVWAAPLLTDTGRIVLAVPNIAHWSIRLSLLFGRFDYAESGILDDTHLRFFTARALRNLLSSSNLAIDEFRPVFDHYPLDRAAHRLRLRRLKRALFDWPLSRVFPNFYAYHFLATCGILSSVSRPEAPE